MECGDVHELADSFLAHELLPETNHVMARHLDGCPECRAHLGAQRALGDAVRRAFQNAPALGPMPEFTTQLRMTLEQAARPAPNMPAQRRMTLHEKRNNSKGGPRHRPP
jgi:anti-sigma factor RsiW